MSENTATGIADKPMFNAAFKYADRDRTLMKLRHPTNDVTNSKTAINAGA
jgi:hypothetical protein